MSKNIVFVGLFAVLCIGVVLGFFVFNHKTVKDTGIIATQTQSGKTLGKTLEATLASGTTSPGEKESTTESGAQVISGSGMMTQEQFDALRMLPIFKLSEDITRFVNVIQDKEPTQENEKQFFAVWTKILKNQGTDANIDGLLACISGKSKGDTLTGEYKKICEGKNVYDEQEGGNYAQIKEQIQLFSKAYNDTSFDCGVFLNKNYDYLPNTQSGKLLNNSLMAVKENSIFTCEYLKDSAYNLKKQFFYYKKAVELKQCAYLKNNLLIDLCHEALKNY